MTDAIPAVSAPEAGLSSARIIDLSQPIFPGMPVYPGHLKTALWTYHTHEETNANLRTGFSYATRGLLISDHGPTHVDALNHMDPDPSAASIDALPLQLFITRGVCVDVSGVAFGGYITVPVLENAFETAGLSVPHGGTVLLWTGHYERSYGTSAWLTDYAGLDRDATLWLADSGAVNIGVDAPSIDTPPDKTYPSHCVCRDRGVLNTENLANLREVAGRSFLYIGLPLRIRDGTASPIRAVALMGDGTTGDGSGPAL
jgi:kynurenine formamidase